MKLCRTLEVETKVLDSEKGIVEYIASDETVDSYRDLIRANGWRFNKSEKGLPFVDSHNYGSIQSQLGRVTGYEVKRGKLMNVVQWAIDVKENTLAQLGFAMTAGGYLNRVSVGFVPVRAVSKYDADQSAYRKELTKLGMDEEDEDKKPRTIYLEQEQVELSAVILGANHNAVAKAYKAGVLDDAALELISRKQSELQSKTLAQDDGHAIVLRARQQRRFLEELTKTIKHI